MLVMSKHLYKDAVAALQTLAADRPIGEIPDAKGFFVCRRESVPEVSAFLERLEEGELVGVLCQKK